MPQLYQYIVYQPTKNIVHLKAVGNARFSFISIERLDWVDNGGFPVKGRNDILIIPVQEMVTVGVVRRELAKLRGCYEEQIEFLKGSTNSQSYKQGRYARRMQSIAENQPPPRGW